ncbi:hypothetical protein VE02_10010 [Pseudogymnoascus sp. 03VT05]|nr:hypothetical protein VE02_10010 [Pseudogymnoascus sp. 03VT05]
MCKRYNLEIIMLQPFSNFEGWERGSKERSEAFSRAKGWIRIMQAVDTAMLQLGSTDSHNVSRSLDVLASDIRELADLLAPHSFRLAYENWCWATVSPTSSQAWAIVQRVDRPNVGLCLDTFQTCGGEYGDPTTASGLIEEKYIQHSLEKGFTDSLDVLAKTVPSEKIYVLQITWTIVRLGPYDRYPAANEDVEDVISAVLDDRNPAFKQLRNTINTYLSNAQEPFVDLDTVRIAISGFSSGGNLALNMAISVEDDPTISAPWPSVIPQSYEHAVPLLLFYPSLDCRMLPYERLRPEGLEVPTGFFARLKLETELMPQYLRVEKRAHPRASPGLADIKGLHPKAKIMLILPQLDSLSALSDIWVEKVRSDGRADDLFVDRVAGVPHGWTQFPDLWLSKQDKKSKVAVFERAKEFLKTHWT